MLFDTPIYFLFLSLVVFSYWRLSWRRQNVFLLLASYFFYGWWDWRFLLLMIFSTVIDYLIAQRIAEETRVDRRRTLLIVSLCINFGLLGFFKYCNFFIGSFDTMLHTMGVHNVPMFFLKIILPPGISFYTFQEIAYVVDVYKGELEPSRSFVDYGLFITLFPHLIAGPIQRPSHLLPQVQRPRTFNDRAFFDGCMLLLSGLFRKTVIADSCANLANAAFDGRLGSNFFSTLIGVYAFAWQIYGDFSGYSDMARGAAQLLGFHFMLNFRQPYLARISTGFLAALAHQPEYLASRLFVYSPGRESKRPGTDLRQSHADDAARRFMARRKLDFRDLGRDPWSMAIGGTPCLAKGRKLGLVRPRVDSRHGRRELDLFSCKIVGRSLRNPS